VQAYHQTFDLRSGIPREELKSRLQVSVQVFDAMLRLLVAEDRLVETLTRKDLPGVNPIPVVSIPERMVVFSPEQQGNVDGLLAKFKADPYSPPTIKDCVTKIGEETYNALIDQGELIPVSGEVVFRWVDYEQMVANVRQILSQNGTISVAQVRDRFDTSRRYVLAFLEHLDAIGVTVRVGDVRKLK
jgi:selenocysteine-specific elongation factor